MSGADPDPDSDSDSDDSEAGSDDPDGEFRAGTDPDAGADPEPDPDPDPDPDPVLDDLFAVIQQRKRELPDDSYTASLFTHEKGQDAILEKLGEETTEVLLAAKDGDREELTRESADLVYHLLVLLAANDVDLADLRAELRARR